MIARLTAFFALIALPVFADVPVKEVTSPGGLKAWLVEAHEIPFIALELRFKGGATLDPSGKEGAVTLMTGLLEEGTGDLDSQGFAAARDDLAASYSFRPSREMVSVSARFLSENQDKAVDLLRRALTEPSFPEEAVERVRMQILSNLTAEERDPGAVAAKLFNEITFEGHLYARPSDGTQDSVKALTVADLQAVHKAALARDNVIIAATGDITEEALGLLLDKLLSGLPEKGGALPGPAEVKLNGQVVTEEFPGPQAVVLFGHEGIKNSDPDFFPAFIASEILGGGRFGTRLMTEVREKRGLTYGIGAGFSSYDQAELLTGQVQTANATVKETIDVIRAEWDRLPDITEEELEATKRYLTGSYPLRWDGNANIARALVGLQLQGWPIDYPSKRNSYIEAVTLEQVRAAAKAHFRAKDLSFIIVGRPEGLDAQ